MDKLLIYVRVLTGYAMSVKIEVTHTTCNSLRADRCVSVALVVSRIGIFPLKDTCALRVLIPSRCHWTSSLFGTGYIASSNWYSREQNDFTERK